MVIKTILLVFGVLGGISAFICLCAAYASGHAPKPKEDICDK